MEYDYKLDYITRQFRKISNKRFEAYVIQRIWDLPQSKIVSKELENIKQI